mmetsp:Transcript_22523/g.50116  ORF Transcript_22523/g.50116 Transcript_22523/m.50116 type:complete len:164 (+) Transcript_22523:238-729(+)
MFWARIPKPASTFATLAQVGKTIATGSLFAVTTTAFSCTLAIAIEGAAHRTLYYLKPHWYDDVTYAYGLPQLEQRHDSHAVCDVVGAISSAGSDNNLAEEDVMIEQQRQTQQMQWSAEDQTLFSTTASASRTVEKDDKDERRTFDLPAAEKLVAHVLSGALTA